VFFYGSLFDGVPDPANPSTFTIRYQLRGKDGTIAGSLRDDESVYLQLRDGSLVLFDDGDYPYSVRARAGSAASK
jgi:hypothetical protein